MSDCIARYGRDHQRYDNQYRLVAGCIPYKLRKDVDPICTVEDVLEVLMVSTADRNDLVFPKGGWEDDESVMEAACRETLEEAGVKGDIDNELGTWEFRSKRRQNCSSLEGICRGHMFTMRVTEELDSWPEQATHGRRWVMVREAFKLCRYPWMCEALEKCLKILTEDYQPQLTEIEHDDASPIVEVRELVEDFQSQICPSEPSLAMNSSIKSPKAILEVASTPTSDHANEHPVRSELFHGAYDNVQYFNKESVKCIMLKHKNIT